MSNPTVKAYYDQISDSYDKSRFQNTYGNFIHKQENKFREKLKLQGSILNLGCGTGRFMEHCTNGFDVSEKMLTIAKEKYPNKLFRQGTADQTNYTSNQFDAIICFHVFMHLEKEQIQGIVKEVHRILKPGGLFIFDYPSMERRNITSYKNDSWHGATSYSKSEIANLINLNNFSSISKKGVLFSPIHRIPKGLRTALYGIDQLLTSSPFKHYSSYLLHAIKKNP